MVGSGEGSVVVSRSGGASMLRWGCRGAAEEMRGAACLVFVLLIIRRFSMSK